MWVGTKAECEPWYHLHVYERSQPLEILDQQLVLGTEKQDEQPVNE